LGGEAAIYKSLLDRNALKDPNTGVDYFKRELRPHFVKGSQSVFFWRFFQLFKAHRGQQDFLRWIGRISVLRKRLGEAWMDLIDPIDQTNPEFVIHFRNLAQQGGNPDPAVELTASNAARVAVHQNSFLVNDNLFALILTVLADLNEVQRERMTSTLALRGQRINIYTYNTIREVFIELFCAPRSSLENPNLRSSPQQGRSFCIIDQGEMDGAYGYSVEDEETTDVGFLPELEDVFWLYDENADAWVSNHFQGRRMRRGAPKGRGKGRGSGG
jgi:hypothetical protein